MGLRNFEWAQGFSEAELRDIERCASWETYEEGEILLKEGDTCRELLMLEEGEVEIVKGIGGPGGKPYVISTLQAPMTLGELSFIKSGERSATVRTVNESKLWRLSREQLDTVSETTRYKFLASIGNSVIDHLRVADNRLLEEVEVRGRFGQFVVLVMLLFLLQNFLTAFITDILKILPMYVITLLALVFATIMCALMMRTVKRPLRFFGLTLKDWPRALVEGAAVAAILLVTFELVLPGRLTSTFLTFVLSAKGVAYVFSAFLQEFTFRGVFQTSLQTFYQDPRGFRTVPLSALAFSSAHVLHDLQLTIASFLASLLLGGLFVRHRSLVGVVLLHYCLGVMAVAMGLLAP